MARFGMTRRHVVAAVAGAALAATGLLLGGGFTASAGGDAGDDGLAVTTTTDAPALLILAEGESLIGNSVFVPLGLQTVGDSVVLDYSLTSLGGFTPTAAPERFVLTTSEGVEYTDTVSTPHARQARFQGAADAEVVEIAVTAWRLNLYEEYDSAFSLTDGVTLSDGTSLTVSRVLEESVGALVYFEVVPGENSGFGGSEFTGPLVITSGPGWQDTLDADRGGSGFSAPSLAVTIDPLPDVVPIHVVALPWVQMEERIVVHRVGGEA